MPFNIQGGLAQIQPYIITFKNINTKVAGPTLLGTIPVTNKIFVPFWAGVQIETITGLTTPPTLSIGTNNPAYDNFVAATALTGLLQGRIAPVAFRAQYPILTAGMSVYANVSIAAVATTYTITMTVLGYPQ